MSTRTGKEPKGGRRARELARRRDEILAAAQQVFAERGYQAASMVEIARAADFAVGTLYKVFASKEALFEQLLLVQLGSLERALDVAIEGSSTVVAALEAVAVVNARWKAERRSFLSIFVSPRVGEFQAVGPELPAVEALVGRFHARFLELIRRGVAAGELTQAIPPEMIALLYGAGMRAYAIEHVLRRGGAVDEDEVRAVVRAQLEGLAFRGERAPPRRGPRPRGKGPQTTTQGE